MIIWGGKAKKHILNILGRKLDRKYIVFESDDWGSERIPSFEDIKYLKSCGIDVYSNPFNHLDSLETEADLSALFEILMKFKDRKGNYPIITANSVTANPDFIRIKASGFREYHYESTLETYYKKKECKNSYSIIKDGISSGLYHPQFHGREHLNIRQWLSELQSGNDHLMKAFDAGIYGIDTHSKFTQRVNFTAAFDITSEDDYSQHNEIIQQGTSMFKEIFGFKSESFIAPCYLWAPSLESVLNAYGIKYIQGLPIQNVPVFGSKYKKIFHFQGEQNKLEQFFFIRNCFFEPSLNQNFNWLDDCIKRLRIIFYWGKPAIIGTHRINFIGHLDERNRTKNLKSFYLLLKTILKIWPEVEFITTDKLGDIYSNNLNA